MGVIHGAVVRNVCCMTELVRTDVLGRFALRVFARGSHEIR